MATLTPSSGSGRAVPASPIEQLLRSCPDGVVVFDRELRYTHWNPRMERITGLSAARVLGQCALDVFPFLVSTGEDRCLHEALLGRENLTVDRPFNVPESGREGFFEGHYGPVYDGEGNIVGGMAIIRDVSERRQREHERLSIARSEAARREAEEASRHFAFLAAAGETLASSLDYERILREVATLALPMLGDLCIVDVVEDGVLRRVAAAHVREDKREVAEALRRAHAPSLDSPQPAARVLRSGAYELVPEVSPREIANHTTSSEHAGLVEALGIRSHLALPLIARGSIVAVISLGITESNRRYGPSDLSLAEELARVAALAVDNARLYRVAQQEVLERRRAEEAYRISASRFRGMFEQSPLSTQLLRADGGTERVNRAFEELWGLTLANLRDYNIRTDPQLEIKGVAPYLERAYAGEAVQIPAIRYDPEETIPSRSTRADCARWVRAFAYPIKSPDGDVQEVVLLHEDVTARLEAEEQARASTERLREALEGTRLLAEAGETLATSLELEQTLENLGHVVVPRFATWCAIDLVREDGTLERAAVAHPDPARVALGFELFRRYPPRAGDHHGAFRVLRTGEPECVERVEDELVASLAHDDEHLAVLRAQELRSYVCVPLMGRGGAIGVMTLARTERDPPYRATDVELVKDLARRAASAVENARLVARLREQDRQKDEFLATLAHELRNPLAPLRTGLEVLRSADANVSAQVRAVMERQLQHMVRLIDDLLDLSRVTRGHITLQPETVDVAALFDASLDVSRPLLESRGVHIELTKPAGLRVTGDRTRLAQVLSNLLNNAAKYTPRGGRVALSAARDGDDVEIRVSDDGTGIPHDKLTAIFEMFVQAHRSQGANDSGLGIGLTLVRRLVELHGGRVWAESAGLGKGSTFVVRLPAALERAPSLPPLEPQERSSGSLRVLVVDDNADAAEMLSLMLELQGHVVRTAESGEAALELLADYAPDVALLDIGLPGMSGHELARRIREAPAHANVLLVAITGWGQLEDRERARAAGFDHHLTKPVEATAVQALLEQHAARAR